MGRIAGQGMNWIRADKRLAIHIRDNFRCVWCSEDLRDSRPGQCTLDHYVPSLRGGSNEPENLVTACGSCNSSHHSKAVEEFLTRRAGDLGHDSIGVLAFVSAGVCKARAQMARPINRRLAKALLESDQPTLEDAIA